MIAGVILAGGRSSRMDGRDKAFAALAGTPLIGHVTARLRPQVAELAISAGADRSRFAALGPAVLTDPVAGLPGPLAGLLAGLRWARDRGRGITHVATAAVDTPFFPLDLVARLAGGARPDGMAVARSAGRIHPVFALVPVALPVALADDLGEFLAGGGSLRVRDWMARHDPAVVDFAFVEGIDPFFNINTPEDLALAEAKAAGCTTRGLGES
jgi:molybdopterin-guanine dinucleotide biosynthesis protein A